MSRVEDFIDSIRARGKKIRLRKVAVMGCAVNGPGEASDADIGIAGGAGCGELVLFKSGVRFAVLPEAEALRLLEEEILNAVEQ